MLRYGSRDDYYQYFKGAQDSVGTVYEVQRDGEGVMGNAEFEAVFQSYLDHFPWFTEEQDILPLIIALSIPPIHALWQLWTGDYIIEVKE